MDFISIRGVFLECRTFQIEYTKCLSEYCREVAGDWEIVVNSVQYKTMKKLMALVDTKSFDSIEEFTQLAEYFPAMYNSIPEYHAITQAFVSAFKDAEGSNLRKADRHLHMNRQCMLRSIISSMKRISVQENKLVKLRAAKVVPIPITLLEQKRLSTPKREMIATAFCVESCKAARLRRLKKQLKNVKLTKLHAAKVVPNLFMSQTRNKPVRTKDDLGKVSAMFCVEDKGNSPSEWTGEVQDNRSLISSNTLCDANSILHTSLNFENIYLHSDDLGLAGSNNESGDNRAHLPKVEVKADGIIDDGVIRNVVDNVDEKRKLEHKGKFLRCLSAIRKLLKKKE